jgi:hypothetical protein
MYRQIFIPNEQNGNIVIPSEWYGKMRVEITAIPISNQNKEQSEDIDIMPVQEMYAHYLASLNPKERNIVIKRQKEREEFLRNYPVDLSNFKFNRDEANDYD